MAFKLFLMVALIMSRIAFPEPVKTDLLYRKSHAKSRKKGHAS
jgi:hypothetical protein